MGHDSAHHPPTVELRVRNFTPLGAHDRQDVVVARLQNLTDARQIRGYSVSSWSKSLSISPDENLSRAATDSLETVREFEAWAANNGHSLEPGFRRRKLTSFMTERTREVIEVPIVCLAVYNDETLRAVYPYSASGTVYTVADGLDALEIE